MESPQEFWQRCSATLAPGDAGRGFRIRCIGNTREMVDQVLGLIIAGDKRGTFSLAEELERAGTVPAPGDYLVLTRWDGAAGCLVQVECCQTVPFNEVGPRELEIEGPGARDPAVWRAIHERYWKPKLEALGLSFHPAQRVLVQRFRLLAVGAD